YRLASNSKRLLELAAAISRKLSEAEDAILSQLAETQRLLRDLEKIDPNKSTLADAHAACVVELSEISRTVGQYAEQLDLDPAQLAALEERVTLFESLKRKYGGSIAGVIAFGERAAERMRKIEGRDAELERLSGEISRLMLAIKSSLAAQDAIPLLVFDEIDANVGGEIANAVGEKMRKLAAEHQVLCITHLPQVAAAAATQFVVTKEVVPGRTH